MMYSFILLSLVVAVYCHQPVPELYDADKYEAKVKRLDEVEELIDRVTTRIQNLKDKRELRQKQKDDADRRSKSILLRLDRMKLNDGSFHCDKPDKEFKCRKNTQCVNNILVCDNVPDCEDKSDEDPDLCSPPVTLNEVWPGHIIYYHCMSIVISSFSRTWLGLESNKILPSFLNIKTQGWMTYQLDPSTTYNRTKIWTMAYNYGSQTSIRRIQFDDMYLTMVSRFYPDEGVSYVTQYIGSQEKPCGFYMVHKPKEEKK